MKKSEGPEYCPEHSIILVDGSCMACELEQDLDACEHRDVKHNICEDCGASLAEEFAARLHDKSKDRRKYGD